MTKFRGNNSTKFVNGQYNYGTIAVMYIVGAGIRYWLMFSKYQKVIENHIEISTPLNAWKRVAEGLFLQSRGINPYDGDLLHEAPLTLWFYHILAKMGLPIEIVFILFDMATSVLFYFIAKRYMFHGFVTEERNKLDYNENSQEYLLNSLDFSNSPIFTGAAFLFNPYMILNCTGCSTMVFHNFFMAIFLLSMLYGNVFISTLSLAICTMYSLYPIVLIIPLFLYFSEVYVNKKIAILTVTIFVLKLIIFKNVSTALANGDEYLKSVYGFILTVPDLQPNIGLFWYFFTEMFDHFRELFICSFQINATILYLIPLSIKFRKDPFILSFALLFLISIFKSYPCLGDIGFVVSLLPCFIHLFEFFKQGFFVGVALLLTSSLGPILWYLWVYANSANANFFFGVTLAFAIANIFFVTDVLFAYVKREFILKHGKERKIDGNDALLVLE